jgi:phosphatidylglycerophosphate synthase
MAKLADDLKFIDLSDYGRRPAMALAQLLKNSFVTPIHATLAFGVCGALGVYCILQHYFIAAAILLVLKSVIDALDGELSRAKNTPSYTGRYLDSVFDIILNAAFLFAICYISSGNYWLAFAAFIAVQLQGTLYNYYYVILRSSSIGADTTSQIFETKAPKAMLGESQKTVNIMFAIFLVCYGLFDRIVYYLDTKAVLKPYFPNWFMTIVSFYGLGFQLLIMAVMLIFNVAHLISIFFIAYTFLGVIILGLRRFFLPH